MEPSSTVYLLLTAALVLLNAFFVAAEFAIVKVRPTRLEQLAAAGDSRAATAVRITGKLDAYLSANQLGITLASLGLGWVGEPAFASMARALLGDTTLLSESASRGLSAAFAFFVITLLHVVIGELAPKSLAIQSSVPVALWVAKPLHWFYLFAWPVITFMNWLGNIVVRMLGIRHNEAEAAHTAEELRLILSRSPGTLDPQIRQMLVRVLDYRRRKARHVMTLASDVVSLRANQTITDAAKIALESRYTRYPVIHPDTHRVLGFVHMQDLFAVYAGARKATRLVEIMREPLYATPDTPVDRLRLEMQSRQLHLAIINGPDGVFAGILTLEDLLEEIVGEIRDESDEEIAPIARRGDGVIEANGRVLIDDLERETGVHLKPMAGETDVETVAAFVAKRLGTVPKVGDRVEADGYLLIITEVTHRRIMRVRIVKEEPSEDEAALTESR